MSSQPFSPWTLPRDDPTERLCARTLPRPQRFSARGGPPHRRVSPRAAEENPRDYTTAGGTPHHRPARVV